VTGSAISYVKLPRCFFHLMAGIFFVVRLFGIKRSLWPNVKVSEGSGQ